MIREIFDVLSAVSSGDSVSDSVKSVVNNVNINKSRIRSISSYSSNSIFYFPTFVSDQLMADEASMVLKMIERSYASFVIACIGLMPFHRVSADDKASIENYLQQFHQNIGINTVNNVNSLMNFVDQKVSIGESANSDIEAAQEYLYECWQRAKTSGENFIKIVAEEVSLNDMFNEDAVDPKTRAIQAKYRERLDELNTWGFLGEATEDLWDDDEEYDDDEDLSEELYAMYGSENDIDLDDEEIEGFDESMLEAALSAKERNKLPDSAFGLPKERKFPLHDAKHVKLAVKMFGHCPEKDRKALAKKIDAAMTKFEINMKISKKNPIAQYLPKSRLSEAVDLNESRELDRMRKRAQQHIDTAKQINKDNASKIDSGLKKIQDDYRKGPQNEDTDIDEIVVVESADVINEGNVKEAIDSLKFSLESVSDNKILSCSSLSKLRTIEAKLNKAKTKYVKYLNRYKKKYNENKKSGSNSKLQITFNKMKISNPKAFMKQYGEYIKLINKKLKMVEKRRAQLRKSKGMSESVDLFGQIEMDNLDYIDRVISEALTKPDSETFSYINEATVTEDDIELTDDEQRDLTKAKYMGSRNALHKDRVFNDKEVFTKMDMQKANDAIPFFARASVGFIVEGNKTEEVVNREVLIGIKAFVHRIQSMELINSLYNTIINKRKFLKWVKFVSGEEKSLSDLIFSFKEMKADALNTRSTTGKWSSAIKRRRRISKMSVPYLMKEYTPNGTLVMTKNEVDYIKGEYGVDIMDPAHIKMVMDEQFLLGFIVVDQSEEIVYVTYDGHGYGFQTYTYASLEREQNASDRQIRELYRSLSR